MHIYLEQPWASREVWEMSLRIMASATLTLVLRRSFPTPCASAHLEAIAADLR